MFNATGESNNSKTELPLCLEMQWLDTLVRNFSKIEGDNTCFD